MMTYFAINRYNRSDIGYFVSSNTSLATGAMFSDNNKNGIFIVIGYSDSIIRFGDKLDPAYLQTTESLNSWDQEWELFTPQFIKTAEELISLYKTAITSKLVSCRLVG